MNGTMATVKELNRAHVDIILESGVEARVTRDSFEQIEYVFDKVSGKIRHSIVGTCVQFPIRLAWAISIHKSQGKTFSAINIDFGRGAFGHGQAYVALSRCTSMDKVNMLKPLNLKDIRVDGVVRSYDSGCRWI